MKLNLIHGLKKAVAVHSGLASRGGGHGHAPCVQCLSVLNAGLPGFMVNAPHVYYGLNEAFTLI